MSETLEILLFEYPIYSAPKRILRATLTFHSDWLPT